MKTEQQLQRAHDVVHAFLEVQDKRPEEKLKQKPETMAVLHAVHDCLVWMLSDGVTDCGDCGEAFARNLQKVEDAMEQAGYTFFELNAPSIAIQDMRIPSCGKQCQTCNGSHMNHHWFIHCDDDDSPDGKLVLGCRHCDARIEEFDPRDPNMPDV